MCQISTMSLLSAVLENQVQIQHTDNQNTCPQIYIAIQQMYKMRLIENDFGAPSSHESFSESTTVNP